MAEEGVKDYLLAKRKAARRLNLPDTTVFPTNQEVAARGFVEEVAYLCKPCDEGRFLCGAKNQRARERFMSNPGYGRFATQLCNRLLARASPNPG